MSEPVDLITPLFLPLVREALERIALEDKSSSNRGQGGGA